MINHVFHSKQIETIIPKTVQRKSVFIRATMSGQHSFSEHDLSPQGEEGSPLWLVRVDSAVSVAEYDGDISQDRPVGTKRQATLAGLTWRHPEAVPGLMARRQEEKMRRMSRVLPKKWSRHQERDAARSSRNRMHWEKAIRGATEQVRWRSMEFIVLHMLQEQEQLGIFAGVGAEGVGGEMTAPEKAVMEVTKTVVVGAAQQVGGIAGEHVADTSVGMTAETAFTGCDCSCQCGLSKVIGLFLS